MTLNVTNARKLLEALRTERTELGPFHFDIRHWLRRDIWDCGTAACLGGTCELIMCAEAGQDPHITGFGVPAIQDWLGIDDDQGGALFCPDGFTSASNPYNLPSAIATIEHLIETGKVEWQLRPAE